MLIDLDLFSYRHLLKTKNEQGKAKVFDPVRAGYRILQPEELVRQLFLHYLISIKMVARGKIGVEKQFHINGLIKRTDIVVYNEKALPFLLVECKSPDIAIRQQVFEQASRYNLHLKAPFLVVTNGFETYCCAIDFENESYKFLSEIPELFINE